MAVVSEQPVFHAKRAPQQRFDGDVETHVELSSRQADRAASERVEQTVSGMEVEVEVEV
jgi:hypothetical protein